MRDESDLIPILCFIFGVAMLGLAFIYQPADERIKPNPVYASNLK